MREATILAAAASCFLVGARSASDGHARQCSCGPTDFGLFVMTTTDEFDASAGIARLLKTMRDQPPCAVVVTVDHKNKSVAYESKRFAWARDNAARLRALAEEVRAQLRAAGAPQPWVLVETINERTCAEGNEVWRVAFAPEAGCGAGGSRYTDERKRSRVIPPAGDPCTPVNTWRNALAYQWGMMRLKPCVRYGVHVDADVQLRKHGRASSNASSSDVFSWVPRAIRVLTGDAGAFAVGPLNMRFHRGAPRFDVSTQAFVVRSCTALP